MSAGLEQIVGRALMDKLFRDNLLANPKETAQNSGISLTAEELDDLITRVDQFKVNTTVNQLDGTSSEAVLSW